MQLEGVSILGESRARAAGTPNPALNPATGQPVGPDYFWAALEDVNAAAELADRAFPEFSRFEPKRRAALLRRIAELFEGNLATLVERANLETALPKPRLEGEAARTCGQLRLFASLIEEGSWVDARIDHADPNRKPMPKPDVRSMLVALGPVVVFSSSNFPFAFSVAGGDTASALAAGCPVVVKPHQGHLGTSEYVGLLIQQAVREASMPPGVFSLVYGSGREVGVALVRHPKIKAVGFTGSRAGGRALMDAAAARPEPIPVYAEMGSINPVFILPGALDAGVEKLATGLHGSVTLGFGQFCTNPGLVFMQTGSATSQLVQKLETLMAATPPGTMLTESICHEFHVGLEKFSQVAGVHKSKVGEHNPKTQEARAALFVTKAETFLKNRLLMDELFGPATLIVECDSKDQFREVASQLEGQLTATLHGTAAELGEYDDLVRLLQKKAGRLVWNGFPTGVEVCHSMTHGGPYPATADGRSTSVGTRAIERFSRPVCYQNFPQELLPAELQDTNARSIWRLVDGKLGQQ